MADELDELLRMTRRLHLATGESMPSRAWRPAADVYRTPEGWLVKVELAGVRPDEIQITRSGRILAIHGRRCDTEQMEGCHYYSLEITYNRFARAIELPCNVNEAEVITEYHNGMLLMRVMTEVSGR